MNHFPNVRAVLTRLRVILPAIAMLLAAASPVRALKVELEDVAAGFEQPLYLTHAGDGSGRMFVCEHDGTIGIVNADGSVAASPFLDLSEKGLDLVSRPKDLSDERGLLGMAFHPEFRTNGLFYVSYTERKGGASVVERYKADPSDPGRALPEGEIVLGPIKQPQWNHNGGMLAFGPDGNLYVSIGDGGFRDDVGPGHTEGIGNGQDTTNVLGTILRINVDHASGGRPYSIPADNPFADGADGNSPEIYAWGLRNVWRFSFDRETGRLFAADVGQNKWEEIDIIVRGGNYGWRRMEGHHCFNPEEDCEEEGMIRPIHEYHHDAEAGGGQSVTGGYVYRGKKYPAMTGRYFFSDYSSGRVWSLVEDAEGKWTATEHFRVGFYLPTFGEDEEGELYLTNYHRGTVLRLIDADAAGN